MLTTDILQLLCLIKTLQLTLLSLCCAIVSKCTAKLETNHATDNQTHSFSGLNLGLNPQGTSQNLLKQGIVLSEFQLN